MNERKLKPGDVVEVRSAAEILATLDDEASIEGMPFMAEMLQHAGKRFAVTHRVEKICDTVSGGYPNSRRMHDTVLLDDLRCDGSAHGGCQAGCRLYWKEAWLRPVNGAEPTDADGDALAQLEARAAQGARATRVLDGVPTETYRCQATEALSASEPLHALDLRQYVRELTSGNVAPRRFLRVAARGVTLMVVRKLRLRGIARRLGVRRFQPPPRPATRPPRERLDLQLGELVEVRSPEEIARDLDASGRSRGLWYDKDEMGPFSGGRYRVKERVERLVDERTGKMIEIASDCLILDDVVCGGDRSECRYFCPRGIYPYWREGWLRRVEDEHGDA